MSAKEIEPMPISLPCRLGCCCLALGILCAPALGRSGAEPVKSGDAACGEVVGEMVLYATLSAQGVRIPPAQMRVHRDPCGYTVDLEPERFYSVTLVTDSRAKIIKRIDPPSVPHGS